MSPPGFGRAADLRPRLYDARDRGIWTDLLEQAREPPVLQDLPAGLVLRAVRRHVVAEEDRLELGAAARTLLALLVVDLEGHRRLVAHLVRRDDLLLVVDCALGPRAVPLGQPLDGRVFQAVAP